MPREATVVAVVRRAHVVVPRGDTVLEPGDEVLVLVSADAEDVVRSLLVSDSGPAAAWLGLVDVCVDRDPPGNLAGCSPV